jgi:hypothetical protein
MHIDSSSMRHVIIPYDVAVSVAHTGVAVVIGLMPSML